MRAVTVGAVRGIRISLGVQSAVDSRRIIGYLGLMADGAIHLLFDSRAGTFRRDSYTGMALRTGDYFPPVNRCRVFLCTHKKRRSSLGGSKILFAMTGKAIRVGHLGVVKDLSCFVWRVALHADRYFVRFLLP